MTHYFYFFAEQAFLSQVKLLAHREPIDTEKQMETGAICVIACVAAIESVVNSLLINYVRFKHFDELRLSSKIEYIVEHRGEEISWGERPWQEVAELIRVRNWLVHYKDSNIGLMNSDGEWIKDDVNKPPKIDPNVHLQLVRVRQYYQFTLMALRQLTLLCKDSLEEYSYLETEQFEPVLVG